jgi:hypothetical protein
MIGRCEREMRENFLNQLEAKTVAQLCESRRRCCGGLRWVHVYRRDKHIRGRSMDFKTELRNFKKAICLNDLKKTWPEISRIKIGEAEVAKSLTG